MENYLLRTLLLLLAALPVIGLAAGLTAQEEPGPRLEIRRFQIHPERLADYEQAMRDWAAAAQEAKLGSEFGWVISEETPFVHWWFRSIDDLHRLDPRTSYRQEHERRFREALGEDRYEELTKQWLPTVESVENWVAEKDLALSYRPADPPTGPMNFALLRIENVRLEKTDAYRDTLARLRGLLARAGYPLPMEIYLTVTGRQNEYYVIFPTRTREELKDYTRWMEERLPELAGEKVWEQLQADWAAALLDFRYYEESQRYDLSYIPAKP
jgi:hypothetical protein